MVLNYQKFLMCSIWYSQESSCMLLLSFLNMPYCFLFINSSGRSNNFIHLWRPLTWIKTVEFLEIFTIVIITRWRKCIILFSCTSLRKNLLKIHQNKIVISLLAPEVRYVISLSSAQNTRFLRKLLFNSLYFISVVFYIHYVRLYFIAFKRGGEIEENPGPKPYICDSLSISHWNLNSISAHNFIKLSLLRAYISINKTDIICLSETYVDSSISSDNDNLALPGYN